MVLCFFNERRSQNGFPFPAVTGHSDGFCGTRSGIAALVAKFQSEEEHEEGEMIEGRFNSRTLANMNVALERVCEKAPHGEDYVVRKRIAKHIVRCASSGKTTLSDLTAAGQRALIKVAAASK